MRLRENGSTSDNTHLYGETAATTSDTCWSGLCVTRDTGGVSLVAVERNPEHRPDDGYALSKAVVSDRGANMALCDVIPEGLRYVLEQRLGDSD